MFKNRLLGGFATKILPLIKGEEIMLLLQKIRKRRA